MEEDKNCFIDIVKEDEKVGELIEILKDLGFIVFDVEKNKIRD